jgi:hypothetical protein
MLTGLREDRELGQVVVVAEQDVELDAAFGLAEIGPRKQRQAQADRRRVQRQQAVLEAEGVLLLAQHTLLAEAAKELPEQRLEHRRRPMLVGVGQRGASGSVVDADVHELAFAAGEAVADLPQGVGARQLREEHGDQVSPGSEALGIALGAELPHQVVKRVARDLLEELTEEAADSYHLFTLRFCLGRLGSGYPEPERRAYCDLISGQALAKSERLAILRFPILDKSEPYDIL